MPGRQPIEKIHRGRPPRFPSPPGSDPDGGPPDGVPGRTVISTPGGARVAQLEGRRGGAPGFVGDAVVAECKRQGMGEYQVAHEGVEAVLIVELDSVVVREQAVPEVAPDPREPPEPAFPP